MAEINNVKCFNDWIFDKSDRLSKWIILFNENNMVNWIAEGFHIFCLTIKHGSVFILPFNDFLFVWLTARPSKVNEVRAWIKILSENAVFLLFSEVHLLHLQSGGALCWKGASDREEGCTLVTRCSSTAWCACVFIIWRCTTYLTPPDAGAIVVLFSDMWTVWLFSSDDTTGGSAELQV